MSTLFSYKSPLTRRVLQGPAQSRGGVLLHVCGPLDLFYGANERFCPKNCTPVKGTPEARLDKRNTDKKNPPSPKNLLRLFFRNNLTRLKIDSEVKNNLKRLFFYGANERFCPKNCTPVKGTPEARLDKRNTEKNPPSQVGPKTRRIQTEHNNVQNMTIFVICQAFLYFRGPAWNGRCV